MGPQEFGVALSKIQATVGIAVILAPLFEAQVLLRTKQNLRYPYLVLALLGAVNILSSSMQLEETLDVAKRKTTSLSSIIKDVNPFNFMKIFSSSNATFKRLVRISALQQFLEGKNLSDLGQMYMRNQLGWDVQAVTKFVVAWGATAVLSGAIIVPTLLKQLGTRTFTTIANCCLATACCLQGASSNGVSYCIGTAIAVPGMNGSSANGLRGLCNKYAEDDGFGGGEFSAMFNNLRAVVGALATASLGYSYAFCRDNGLKPGISYALAGVAGAVIPQVLLQSVPNSNFAPDGRP